MGFTTLSTIASLAALLRTLPFTSARSVPEFNTLFPRQNSNGTNSTITPTPGFQCSYPPEWKNCNTADNRGCWLKNDNGDEFNITTDFETKGPQGTTREYWLEVTEGPLAPDGFTKEHAFLFNGSYPGPTLEACWGDTVIVNVKNSLPAEGTTIHWHGVRQYLTNTQDGVNGVTQCPTAPGDTIQYKFNVTQYGHSWYHSHYGVQYTDGLAGPLVFYGPSSAQYTDELEPIIVSDWLHDNATIEFEKELGVLVNNLPQSDSLLVNGTGRFGATGDYFRQTFEKGKKYLIRIINGSTDLHFQFSIDGHHMQVISTDFVPIVPYNTTSLNVAIGQRYSVIVEANPDTPSDDGQYWMRTDYNTDAALGCNSEIRGAANTTAITQSGIITYADANPSALIPNTTRHAVAVTCDDEPYESLKPVVEWNFSDDPGNGKGNNVYNAGADLRNGTWHNAWLRWSLTDTPLWLNASDPLLLNLDNATFNDEYAVVKYDSNWETEHKWVYLIITATGNTPSGNPLKIDPSIHPIHLHGHDFAIIAQSNETYDPTTFKPNTSNPPRRDVATLPMSGYLAIAFKPDNPGAWILHCHIAWHAGSGLALNVLERQTDLKNLTQTSLQPVKDNCARWDKWQAENPGLLGVQRDSGI